MTYPKQLLERSVRDPHVFDWVQNSDAVRESALYFFQ